MTLPFSPLSNLYTVRFLPFHGILEKALRGLWAVGLEPGSTWFFSDRGWSGQADPGDAGHGCPPVPRRTKVPVLTWLDEV